MAARRIGQVLQVLAACWALQALPGLAVDNPERPDPVAAFASRAEAYETRIAGAGDGRTALAAEADYAGFLERELNLAYASLLRQLDHRRRADLVGAQRRWLAFRDAELRLIAANWAPQSFGSSSASARAGYRSALVRGRVETLLGYLRSYPPEPAAMAR